MIEHGSDVNATSKRKKTALMCACQKGNVDTINVLLNAGANTNIADANGSTCLHHAARNYCCTEVIQAIMSHGVDVNATNKKNVTPLMIACENGNKDAINALLNARADPNIADANGFTCLSFAVYGGCSEGVLKTIIEHLSDVNATSKQKKTALMCACEKGNVDMINVGLLLNAGANPNIADANGSTFLHYAARNDSCTEVVQAIISHGADVHATDKNNVTALMIACGKGNKDAINALLNSGADPNIADDNGFTCLSFAVYSGCSEGVLKTIIDHGVDVNATSKQKKTALTWACEKGNVNTINVLLNAGANPSIADVEGDTCLHHAARNDCGTGNN